MVTKLTRRREGLDGEGFNGERLERAGLKGFYFGRKLASVAY